MLQDAIALAGTLAVDPVVVPFDFATAGYTPASVIGTIQANSLALGPIALTLFGVGMALRWVSRFTSTFKRVGK